MEKKLLVKFYGVFDHFSGTYHVVKFWMIKLYLDQVTSYTRINIQNMIIVAYM